MSGYIEITSKDNPLVKQVSALQTSSRARRDSGLFVLEGLRICLDAYENGLTFEMLIVSKSAYEKHQNQIASFETVAVKKYILNDSLFKKISDTDTPQGIIAVAKMPEYNAEISKNGRYIALENLQDPSNLGAIARTAEALGVSGIIMNKTGCDPYSPKSLRASMGTLIRLPVWIVDDISDFITDVGLTSYACVVDKCAQSITDTKFKSGDVIIIGNEANGISNALKEKSDKLITIPMSGMAESLNAAAAAAIAMWEMING